MTDDRGIELIGVGRRPADGHDVHFEPALDQAVGGVGDDALRAARAHVADGKDDAARPGAGWYGSAARAGFLLVDQSCSHIRRLHAGLPEFVRGARLRDAG
jgi:hypothetical protein